MVYPIPITVTESERDRWKAIVADLLLSGESPQAYEASSAIGDPDTTTCYFADPYTGRLICTKVWKKGGELPSRWMQHSVHVMQNNAVGPAPGTPSPSAAFRYALATYEAVFPERADCSWYMWVGGERWWEDPDPNNN